MAIQPGMTKRKRSEHYVNNKEFLAALIKYREDVELTFIKLNGRTPTKEDMFIMNLDNVMTISESTDMEMICMHQNFIRDSHEDAQQHTKLNRRMGYVATVNAARQKLEEIYKDSQNTPDQSH